MKRYLFLMLILLTALLGSAQFYDMTEGTFEVCKGIFRDPGGESNYSDDTNVQSTFCSANGGPLKIEFNMFEIEDDFDQLTAYDGPDTKGDLIGSYSGVLEQFEICSETGCITFLFTTDISVNASGWEAEVLCTTCEDEIEDNVVLISEGTRHSICDGAFYDSGYIENYGNNQNYTQTICASQSGNAIVMTILEAEIERYFDFLTIHDGPEITLTPLVSLTGQFTSEDSLIYCSDTGCLTLEFTSDESVTAEGWVASINCQYNCAGDDPPKDTTIISVQEPLKKSVYAYPNPIQDQIKLAGVNGNERYQLFDQLGSLVQEGRLNNARMSILNELSRGIYTLVIFIENEPLSIKMFK